MCFSASRRRRAESFLYRRISAPLSRFALGKFSGPRGGAHFSALLCESGVAGFRALLWESRRARAFALCSGEARRATLSRFALAKSTGRQDFRTLLWRSPLCGWTFRLCSGKVRRAGGLSDFALAKSVGAVDFRTLLWRSPSPAVGFCALLWESQRARSSFALCSGEAPPGHTFPLCSGEVTRRALSRFALGKCVVCDKGLRRFR